MRLYLDTEFNSFGGSLMSMALCSEDGSEWYGVLPLPLELHPWVRENVVPQLWAALPAGARPGEHMVPEHFRNSLHAFLGRHTQPEVVCDWHTDAAHFCHWLSGRDHASSLDYPCTVRIVSTPPGQPISPAPHNALADARALKDWYRSNS